MLSLMGPQDLKLYLDGKYLMGKDWSRGFITNTHTYENPLELWKYFWRDSDGVAGSNIISAAVLDPGVYDTSLRQVKSIPDNLPFTVTHHALMVERRSTRDTTAANDGMLTEDNLLELEARCWYELYLVDDKVPADEGIPTEFPPGFGPEGDFTTQATTFIRTGMNNLSVVRPLPAPVEMKENDKVRAIVRPVHGVLTFTVQGGANAGYVGVRSQIHWFKLLG